MKISIPVLFIACIGLLLQTGCEEHPARETIPGYAEKKANQEQVDREEASRPEQVNPNPPKFFPAKPE